MPGSLQLGPLRVAHVEGDNIADPLPSYHADGYDLEHLDTGAPLKDWGRDPISADAYLGRFIRARTR